MSLRRNVGRLIRRKPTGSSRRIFSTATDTENLADPTISKRLLYEKVKANPNSSIPDILSEWANQDKILKNFISLNLINYLRNRKNYQSALQLYDWMESNKFEISDGGAAVRIDLICISEGLASAEKYFNSLPDSLKTNKTYGALLNCYRKERVVDKALEIFDKMKALNYTSILNYNNVLSLYLVIGQPEKNISLVQEMEEKQIIPNSYTYNLLMNSYAALKDFYAVEEVLTKMRRSNVACDSFTFGNLATIYFYAGLHEKADECLEKLEKMQNLRGGEVFTSCQTRINLYSEMNDLSGVNRAWESLKSRFRTPNNTAYLFMLLALSKLGELDSLEKLFKEWEGICFCYDMRIPNVLLEFYLSRNMIEKAMALYESLSTVVAEPKLRTLNSFTILCLKTGQIDLALKYLEMGIFRAGVKNLNWFPKEETIKLFLDYFEEKNDVDRAGKFIQIMKKVERLDTELYDSLLLNVESETSIVGR